MQLLPHIDCRLPGPRHPLHRPRGVTCVASLPHPCSLPYHAMHYFSSGLVWVCRGDSTGFSEGCPLRRLRHATCALQGLVQAQGGQQAVRHCCHSRLLCRACSQGGAAGEAKGFHGLRRRGCGGHAQPPVLRSAALWSVCACRLQMERAPEYTGASIELGLQFTWVCKWALGLKSGSSDCPQVSSRLFCVRLPASRGEAAMWAPVWGKPSTELDTCRPIPREVIPCRLTSG